jgi:hypothetical protein
MDPLREKGILGLSKAQFGLEHLWRSGLDAFKTLEDQKQHFAKILESLAEVEQDITQTFAEMVIISTRIVDPAVKVLTQVFAQKNNLELEEQKVKWLVTSTILYITCIAGDQYNFIHITRILFNFANNA